MPEGPTWIVLIRDISHAVRVAGEPRMVASLVLDAQTGLARGMSVGRTGADACRQAMQAALTQPAGPLLPQPPAQVLCGVGHQPEVTSQLTKALHGGTVPTVTEVISVEAEDVFDSFVGHMAGRRQPDQFASPEDWQQLTSRAGDFLLAQPWQRWADDEHLDLIARIGGVPARYVTIVLGQADVQRGLVLYPGGAFPEDLHDHQSVAGPGALPAGTILFYLDPPAEAPPEFVAKAARYGWPNDADLIPVWIVSGPDGPADLDHIAVQRLTIAVTAVLAHHRNAATGKTTGTLAFADGRQGAYTIG